MSEQEDQPKIIVDEDWKSQVRAEKEAAEKEAIQGDAAAASSPGEAASGDAGGGGQEFPPPSFAEIVTIFATQATMLLQQSADPENAEAAQHREYGKHFIDLLGVLEEKTKGNLTDDEAKMIDNVLHELRMAFVSMNS